MKIALAQIASSRGEIDANIARHVRAVQRAGALDAELIVFPELSISQYEPSIVESVALTPDDPRFLPLRDLSERYGMTVCVGVPIRRDTGIVIGMSIFAPHSPPRLYTKRHLHADEEPFFVAEQSTPTLALKGTRINLAICYEISVPQHAQDAHVSGAAVYLASVAKTPAGVLQAHERLAQIARKYEMTVLMVNCVGECEGKRAGGRSAIWDARGELLGSLNDVQEALLIYDLARDSVSPSAASW